MKKFGVILAAVFLISVCASFQGAGAQAKTKEEKEKELRLQEAIDEQKKAMIEEQKAQHEAQKEAQEKMEQAIIIQKEAVDKAMEEVNEKIGRLDNPNDRERLMRIYEDMGKKRIWSTGEPFVFAAPNLEFLGHEFNHDAEKTSWDFSKTIKESSFSRDYIFDVEPSAKSVLMSVSGDCEAGEIRIKIVMPNGKTYSEIVIDEYGNLNWRKSLTISDTENKDKTGAWKFEIKSSKASGYFRISFQAS